jgi:RNA polymerase sigma factor (sigma-70 family)
VRISKLLEKPSAGLDGNFSCRISASGGDILVKMTESDLELLKQYAQGGPESAFAEIVRRHVNLVYSAAVRQVRSPQLAEEVAQSVFTDLAQNAKRLAPDTILTAWLYQVTRRTAIDVVRRESRRQLREQIATEMNAMNATAEDWTQIEPLLDEAMEALDATDRTAVLLRYFENQSFREVGERLGTTDDAAQKRVSRAVERLREFFSKRGVTVGASGLVAIISANAVQAAPAGLALTISTASTIGATSAVAATTATVTKVIAMTTLQKTVIATAIVVATGAGIYEAHQATQARKENVALQEKQVALKKQVEALQQERDDASNQLAMASATAAPKADQKSSEVLKLRGQVGALQQTLSSISATNGPQSGIARMMNDPAMRDYIHQYQAKMIRERYEPLFKELKLTPENTDKFTKLIGDIWAKGTDAASGGGEATLQHVQEAVDNANKELQSMLGESGFARYNEFNMEMPARTTVKLLDNKLGDNPLSEQQTAQLVRLVMSEPFELTHGISGDWDKSYMGSQAAFDEYIQKVQSSQQRILQQASSFLDANQLSALAAVQTDSLNARKTQAAAFTQKH